MINAPLLGLMLWNHDFQLLTCSEETVQLLGALSQQDVIDHFFDFSPEVQPTGEPSKRGVVEILEPAFLSGKKVVSWMHRSRQGEDIPVEVTAIRLPFEDDCIVATCVRDLRQQLASEEKSQLFRLRLKAVLDATPWCLNLWTADLQNVMCNREAVKLFNLNSEQEYLDRFFELSPERQPSGELSSVAAATQIKKAIDTGRAQFRWIHSKFDGELIPAEITLVRIEGLDDDGGDMVAGYTRDLREQLQLERADRTAALRIRAVVEASPLACLLWNLQGEILDCNQVSIEMFGAKNRADLAKNFASFMPSYQPDGLNSLTKKEKSFKEVKRTGRGEFEWLYRNRAGEDIPCEVTVVRVAVQEGEEDILVSYSRDLRELRKTLELNERLSKLAHFDTLTGCLSRVFLYEKLDELFNTTTEEDVLVLSYFDFDAFKEVNDTYGHEAGDITLKCIVKIVTNCLPENALVGRIGGDEFVIVLQGVARAEMKRLMGIITEAVSSETLHCHEASFTTSVSLGAAFKDSSDKRPKDLLRRADTALYEAKRQGRNRGVIAD